MEFPDTNLEDIKDVLSLPSAFLVIDMQNDFSSPKGCVAQRGANLEETLKVPARIGAFLDVCRGSKKDVKIVHIITHHSNWTNSDPWMRRYKSMKEELVPICVPETWGAEITEEEPRLLPQKDEYFLIKHRYSAFIGTDLDLILRAQNIKTLIVSGIATNVCVESTIRHGHMLDYHIVLLRDLTASGEPDQYLPSLRNVQRYFGYISTSTKLASFWESK